MELRIHRNAATGHLIQSQIEAAQMSYLERREHLSLFFSVEETMLVLHRYERSQAMGDGVVCLKL